MLRIAAEYLRFRTTKNHKGLTDNHVIIKKNQPNRLTKLGYFLVHFWSKLLTVGYVDRFGFNLFQFVQ